MKADFDLPYQVAGQVRQLLAERANAEAYGNTGRMAAVDTQLAQLGYCPPPEEPQAVDTPPVGGAPAPRLGQTYSDPRGRRGPRRSTT